MSRVNLSASFRLLLLLFLVVLGSAIRLHHLGSMSLWADELFTLSMALYHPLVPEDGKAWFRSTSVYEIQDGDTFWTAKAAEQHPPLHDLLEKISINLLGVSEFSARLPGALASCMLLAWFAWFAARSKDPQMRATLVWALLLLACSPVLVAYAKIARPYSLGTTLVGMGALLWLLRWWHGWRQVRSPGWGEILLLLLACYTHYNAAALAAMLLGADLVVACKTRNVTTLKRIAFLGAAFSLWLVPAAHTIVATAGGRMAWDRYTVPQNVFSTFTGVAVVVHSPWLWMFLAASWFALARHLFRSPQQALPAWLTRLFFLCSLILLYLGLAGFIVAKAGMAHFRFYVFAVPLFAIAAATLLAQLRRRWAIAVAALLISATALPAQNAKRLIADEDWRSMTQAAVRGADEHTVFLFPFVPNRDHYRIYLEKYLQQDSRLRMVGVSNKEDISSVCERLSSARHVAVMGYASSRQIIDDVYAACGRSWPARERHEFTNTFAEHWRAVSGGSANPPPGLGSLSR
jgi:hypothetical protein